MRFSNKKGPHDGEPETKKPAVIAHGGLCVGDEWGGG
jgi:hypothetical protein